MDDAGVKQLKKSYGLLSFSPTDRTIGGDKWLIGRAGLTLGGRPGDLHNIHVA